MRFILTLAWRDSRSARRRLLFFALAIVLGVAALVAIGSFSANLRQAIEDQAKGILGADLAITSRSPLTAEAQTFIDSFGGEQSREVTFASMVVFPSAAQQTRLITVRAVSGGYPFYGDYVTTPADAPRLLADGQHVILEETLLRQFGVAVGDPVKLGNRTFTLAGALQKLPGDSAAVATLSPRVLVSLDALPSTGLIGQGSLVRYRTWLRLPPTLDVDALVTSLRDRFAELRLGFDTVAERKQDLGQALKNVDAFLSLVGFIALFLGAIGVASSLNAYVQQKLTTVAVLRCLGASSRQTFAIYLTQGLALGALGAGVGALLGVLVQVGLPGLLKDFLPFTIDFFISWPAVVRGFGAGLIVCVLFTLLPLLAVRRVSPLMAIRAAWADTPTPADPLRWAVLASILVAVTGFAVWQTGRWTWGLGFTGGLLASFAVLTLLARGITWTARHCLPAALPYLWRQGLANLHRPHNRTVLLLVSLGLGTFLLLTLALTRSTLLDQLRGPATADRPNLLFFDIQDDQIEPLTALLAQEGAPIRAAAPVVTLRLSSLKGRSVESLLKDDTTRMPTWLLRREYRATFRDHLSETEKLIAGSFVGRVSPEVAAAGQDIPICIEQGLAKDLRVGLGDQLGFDVQGVPMTARISSIREVEWRRLSPNFFLLFPAGVLEPAPKFHVVAARSTAQADSARVQQAIVRAFPNVSVLDLALVIQTLDGVLSKVEAVIQFMALFTVCTGLLVLMATVLTGRQQRLRETVLLRTLGASRRQLTAIQLVEYSVLGGLAALTGTLLAVGASSALAVWVFQAPVALPWMTLVGAIAGVSALTVTAGWLTSSGLLNRPPLEVLRAEG